jgi:hypothetical protein
MTGTRTFGNADVEAGSFPQFRHEVVNAVQNDSKAIPLIDKEGQFNQSKLIPVKALIPHTKEKAIVWKAKMTEYDALCALLNGASDQLLMTTKGGKGITLPGAAAGAIRSPYNVFVVGGTGLVIPSYTWATHETNIGTALSAVTTTAAVSGFDYEQHKICENLISELRFSGVKVGNASYRAVCLVDPRNYERLFDPSGNLSILERYANSRSEKNPALDGMQTIELDNILYVKTMYLKYFRPTVTGGYPVWMTPGSDPYASTFSNTNALCANIYITAGSLLRGTRGEVWFTGSGEGFPDAGHTKGTTICLHYYDAWKRKGWVTKDGTNSILDDATMVAVYGDPGVGVAYST